MITFCAIVNVVRGTVSIASELPNLIDRSNGKGGTVTALYDVPAFNPFRFEYPENGRGSLWSTNASGYAALPYNNK